MRSTKRVLLLLLVFALVFPTASAWASEGEGGGLGGLAGGGLSGLLPEEDVPEGDPGVVIDPAELLGTEGSVLQEDYQFSPDYLCTAYVYAMPANANGFVSAYTQQMEINGFTAEQTLVDGVDGWSYTWTDGTYALLVPDFEGSVLLLVQDGMTFGEPLPEGYYLRFTRNGRTLEANWSSENASCSELDHYFYIRGYFSRAEISSIMLRFPNYAQPGDEYDGAVATYTNYDSPESKKSDYMRIKINDMYEADGGTAIEGEFDASFNRGEAVYTDGSFRVLLLD